MNWRGLIALLVLSALALVFALLLQSSEGQQGAKLYRIGYLGTTKAPHLLTALIDGLRALGYVEGRDFVIEFRWAEGKPERFPSHATELVAAGVDVIIAAGGNQAVLAAKAATREIPIVTPWVVDPVGTGLISSLARPGGNVTGLTYDVTFEQAGKRLEIFRELVPTTTRLANLWNPTVEANAGYWPAVRAGAQALGISVYSIELTRPERPEERERAFASILRERPSGVFVWSDSLLYPHRRAICEMALKHRLPTLTALSEYVEAGCLVSYAVNNSELFRRAAYYVAKVLQGTKPGDLPIERPSKLELVINLKTAKALGLTIPPSLLARADQVIE
jgi:ABC-type uncharacterized transport system substrate-binding protein